ncbi:MAG: BamA/TamA family outer membrane protein [Bacteroidota bacterium]|nr:BamA/TamA family outer membrane protein [Bacteroidota bacterium]
MRILFLLYSFYFAFVTLNIGSLNAQSLARRYVNNLLDNKSPTSESQLLIYPSLAYAPETTWEFGFNSLYVYFAKKDTTNRLSEINGFTFFTLQNQYGAFFDHAIYSDKDRWFFLGKLRFQSFPLYYHGIGANTPKAYIARVDANQFSIKERVLRKLKKNLFLGLEMEFQNLSNVDFKKPKHSHTPFQLPLGYRGSSNLGLGFGLVRDDRHNVLNVRKGFFSELAFLHYNPKWGSNFNFTTFTSDTRLYRPIGKRNVLAAQFLGQFNIGSVPFNQLALLGGESMMRGYYYGRYRDKNQLAAQAEYRFLPIPFRFSKRIGAVVFAGAGTVFDKTSNIALDNIKLTGGAGLRFLLFPKKDIWTRLDYAVTREGGGIYLLIGEAF